MTTTLEHPSETAHASPARERRAKVPSIIVATDGSSTAESAFRAAHLIASATDAHVHVITVLELLPIVVPVPEMILLTNDADTSRSDAQRKLVREQLAKVDPARRWSMEMRHGRPGEVIARVARDRNADLIIMGMNKHGLWDRFLGEETAMEIARLTEVPLFIAASDLKRLPRRVVLAMDLKPGGLRTMPDVVPLIGNKLSLSCVHVKPRNEFLGIDWADLDREYELAVQQRFREMEKELEMRGVRSDLVVLNGEPARELIEFAGFSKAELVMVGINRRPGRSRAIGGRMAARLVRRCDCSLLIVPATLTAAAVGCRALDATETLYDAAQWAPALRKFTARNVGRRATVEVDDPRLGAFVEVNSYPLLGVDYDHRDGRVDIMLGDFQGGERHLTRSIPHPASVSIRTVGGSDSALSVAHNAGQTLVTFVAPGNS
jgi:nucleotide-binding universal stress UspA family protein